VTDALFHNSGGFNDWFANFAAIFGFGSFQACFVDSQGIGMDGCLWYETVGERKSDDAAYKASAAE
jgi:hypothetical protein